MASFKSIHSVEISTPSVLGRGRNTQNHQATGQVIPNCHLSPLSGDDVNACYVVSCRFNGDQPQQYLYDPLRDLALQKKNGPLGTSSEETTFWVLKGLLLESTHVQ